MESPFLEVLDSLPFFLLFFVEVFLTLFFPLPADAFALAFPLPRGLALECSGSSSELSSTSSSCSSSSDSSSSDDWSMLSSPSHLEGSGMAVSGVATANQTHPWIWSQMSMAGGMITSQGQVQWINHLMDHQTPKIETTCLELVSSYVNKHHWQFWNSFLHWILSDIKAKIGELNLDPLIKLVLT